MQMKNFLKKTKELLSSWAANEKNWFVIGVIGRQVYFTALFISMFKMLALQMYRPHREDMKDISAYDRFLLSTTCLSWMYPVISMMIETTEHCTRKREASNRQISVIGEKVHLLSELDFSLRARIFMAFRVLVAIAFSAGAIAINRLNRLADHDLVIVLIIVVLDVLGRIVEQFSMGKVHSIKEKILNDAEQAKLFERIEKIFKQEQDKLDKIDTRPYIKQRAETKLDKIALKKLVGKIEDRERKREYEHRRRNLNDDIYNADQNRPISPRSSVGFLWYRIGCISYFFTIVSLVFLYLEPCVVSIFTTFPDYPYTFYFWITAYLVIHFIFVRANATEHGFPGCFYDRILHYKLFVAFGPNATRNAICDFKKTTVASLLFSIFALIFYHNSLLSVTEFQLFITLNTTFFALCALTFFCFSKFVNQVVEAEKNNLGIRNEKLAEDRNIERVALQ